MQKIKFISYPIMGFMILCSCSNSTNQENKSQDVDTIASTEAAPPVNLLDTTTVGKSALDTTKRIFVKLFQKKMIFSPSDSILSYNIIRSNEKNCKDWKMPSEKDLPKLFESFYKISGNEWHDCYGDMSCSIEGKILYNSKEYNYRLDAGGWIMLFNRKEQLYFGCKSPDCKKYFPNDCFCNENGLVDE